jgi:hypothetical protein
VTTTPVVLARRFAGAFLGTKATASQPWIKAMSKKSRPYLASDRRRKAIKLRLVLRRVRKARFLAAFKPFLETHFRSAMEPSTLWEDYVMGVANLPSDK